MRSRASAFTIRMPAVAFSITSADGCAAAGTIFDAKWRSGASEPPASSGWLANEEMPGVTFVFHDGSERTSGSAEAPCCVKAYTKQRVPVEPASKMTAQFLAAGAGAVSAVARRNACIARRS